MKPIQALLKKDLITLRPLLTAWGICVAVVALSRPLFALWSWGFGAAVEGGAYAWNGSGPLHSALARQWAAGIGFAVFGFSLTVMALLCSQVLLPILAARLVHADSLIHRDAFWRTRPIPRRLLLAEKALWIGGLFVATAAAAWTCNPDGSPSENAARVLEGGVFLSGVVAFASVTRSISHLIVMALGCAMGGQLLTGILGALWFRLAGVHHIPGGLHSMQPAGWDVSAIYLAGFLAVTVSQYLTLKTSVSRWGLLGVFALTALAKLYLGYF